jgi:hypothetical protein
MGDRRSVIAFAAAAAVMAWVVGTAVADGQHQQRRRYREREHRKGQSESAVPAVDNPTYQEACGACHFPLQPALLPSRSWQLLLAGSQDHFGQSIDLDAEKLAEVEAYLTDNAAERTPGELAQERGEHRRLDDAVFERASVAGRADCPACHPGAATGVYDDDSVKIPSR